MSKSIRIRTTPNGDDKYVKVELKQDFDLLEVLSLNIKQEDVYRNFCSTYGVVAGRVIVNNGFGVPNVKVSIFIPIEDVDKNNPIIRQIYPYETPNKDEKNVNGIRYNLLPNTRQNFDHTPVGTFPEKSEILDDQTTLEIYDKYYKYTTVTNNSGDFILFGIPVGNQILHYDMDVSDIGFLSARPFELMSQGFKKELFLSPFKFKNGRNLDSLAQITSQNIAIDVQPFWCDDLSQGRTIGITRQDINIDSLELIPTATFFGSMFSDDEKDSINKNCGPRKKMGKMTEVITNEGKLEAIIRTSDGDIEDFDVPDDAIDINGNWALQIPMNLRKVVTDEFGNLVPSPDGIKGVATECDIRFRISMDKTSGDKRLRQRASFLVPNMTGNYNYGEYDAAELTNGDPFKVNPELSTYTDNTPYAGDPTNQYNYLEEFYTLRWKKVYSVRQYIGRYQKTKNIESRGFTGIKDVVQGEGVNKFPSNRLDTNFNPLYTIICILLGIFAYLVGIINGILNIFNGLITAICEVKIPVDIDVDITFNSCSRCCVRFQCYDSNDSSNPKFTMMGPCTGSDPNTSKETCKETDGALAAWYQAVYKGTSWNGHDCVNCTSGTAAYPGFTTTCIPGTQWYIGIDAGGNHYGPSGLTGRDNFCQYSAQHQGFVSSYPNNYSVKKIDKKTDCSTDCDPGLKLKVGSWCRCLNISITFKKKCILSPLICKKCQSFCPGEFHSCCRCPGTSYDNGWNCGRCTWPNKCNAAGSNCNEAIDADERCCNQCCVKIPLIGLRCDGMTPDPLYVTALPSPFAAAVCNGPLITPCVTCVGLQWSGIKNWQACKLEGLAQFLNMVKFDFYNDWVSGSLYFPLFKRKYKIKTSKKKFGQIKKDKFCDFQCNPDYQQPETYFQWRIKIKNNTLFQDKDINVSGCKVTFKANYKLVSNWYGDLTTTNAQAKQMARDSLVFKGVDSNSNGCRLYYSDSAVQAAINQNPNLIATYKDRELPGPFGKPKYVKSEDPITGIETWTNIGGNSHHKNKCNRVFTVERKEYFKDILDCDLAGVNPSSIDGEFAIDNSEATSDPDYQVNSACDNNPFNDCDPACIGKGVKACTAICGCKGIEGNYNDNPIRHGLIRWENSNLYYASIIEPGDSVFNQTEYKSNLLFPTNIVELGSSVYCDIDDVPFIMDKLTPTTFQVSEEGDKFKINPNGNVLEIEKIKERNGDVNLSAYVEFGCLGVVCMNTQITVVQSQIGVDIIDKDNIDREFEPCVMYADHDEEIREYFCNRFNGFQNSQLGVHYLRPDSPQLDNIYTPYPDALQLSSDEYKDLSGQYIDREINDAEEWVSGDRCGYTTNSNPDYFYGAAPGFTSKFVNFPGGDIDGSPIPEENGVLFNQTQTPYYMYFGIIPGKTALHRVVAQYFADKIDKKTLQGVTSPDESEENYQNKDNFRNVEQNKFSLLKSCLGTQEILEPTAPGGGSSTGDGSGSSGGDDGGSTAGGATGDVGDDDNFVLIATPSAVNSFSVPTIQAFLQPTILFDYSNVTSPTGGHINSRSGAINVVTPTTVLATLNCGPTPGYGTLMELTIYNQTNPLVPIWTTVNYGPTYYIPDMLQATPNTTTTTNDPSNNPPGPITLGVGTYNFDIKYVFNAGGTNDGSYVKLEFV